jgi:hypothetical protein
VAANGVWQHHHRAREVPHKPRRQLLCTAPSLDHSFWLPVVELLCRAPDNFRRLFALPFLACCFFLLFFFLDFVLFFFLLFFAMPLPDFAAGDFLLPGFAFFFFLD